MDPERTPRDEYTKCGLPATHSKIPDGGNPEFIENMGWVDSRVYTAEADKSEEYQPEREADKLDWSKLYLNTFSHHYRSAEGPGHKQDILNHKRHGE